MHDTTPRPPRPLPPIRHRRRRNSRFPLVVRGRVVNTASALRREQLIAAREVIEGLAKMREGIDVVSNALMPLFDVPGFGTVVEMAVSEFVGALQAIDRRRRPRSGRSKKGAPA